MTMENPPMGPVSLIGLGQNFEHANVRVALSDDANGIMAQLTDGALVDPFHEMNEVELQEGFMAECHIFYHPVSRQGVACIAIADDELAVRTVDMSGFIPAPMLLDFTDADQAVDERGPVDRLRDGASVHYGPGGTIAVDLPDGTTIEGSKRE